MDSFACGSRGAALLDHQFVISRKQTERRFLVAFSPAIVVVLIAPPPSKPESAWFLVSGSASIISGTASRLSLLAGARM